MEVVEQTLRLTVDLSRESLRGRTELRCVRRRDGFDAVLRQRRQAERNHQQQQGNLNGNASLSQSFSLPGSAVAKEQQSWEEDKKIVLNCRQCVLERVLVNGVEADFELQDYLSKIVVEDNIKDLKTYYAYLTESLLASRDGELSIQIPETEVSAKELVVSIHYHLENPKGGVHFAGCGSKIPDLEAWQRDGYSYRRGSNGRRYFSYMYTSSSLCGGGLLGGCSYARCWFPCVDSLQARCKIRLEITTAADVAVISVGKKIDDRVHGTEHTVVYEHEDPIAPCNVALCVGPFLEHRPPKANWLRVYYLPNDRAMKSLKKASIHLRVAVKRINEYLLQGKFVYSSFKQIFIDREDAYADVVPFASMSFVSDELLRSDRIPTPDTPAGAGLMYGKHLHYEQAKGVAYQYFGALVPPKSEGDVWLIAGLAGFLSFQYASNVWKLASFSVAEEDQEIDDTQKSKEKEKEKQKAAAARKSKDDATFYGSTNPKELLVQAHNRLRNAKARHDAVAEWHGLSAALMQRPLQRPPEAALTVDSCLWAARGVDFDCLLAERAINMMHVINKTANPREDEDVLGGDDPFVNILRHYITEAQENNEIRAAWLKHMKEAGPTDDGFKPKPGSAHQEQHLDQMDFDLGDRLQKELNMDPALAGISDFDLMMQLCRVGVFRPTDFQPHVRDNFAEFWMRNCSFLDVHAAAEFKVSQNNLEFNIEQHQRGKFGRHELVKFPLMIRVVEEDDTWIYEKKISKRKQRETIHVNKKRQKQRGGRKARTEHERINKWENPGNLKTSELVEIMSRTGEGQVWVNDKPVKYIILDPDFVWIRDLRWRQSDVMNIELLQDPNMIDDVMAQVSTVRDLAVPKVITDRLIPKTGKAGVASASSVANDLSPAGSTSGSDAAFDLRNLCTIASCVMDHKRPPRVRAEGLLALAKWQAYHSPIRAAYEQDEGLALGDRTGNHPWVALNMLQLAIRRNLFHPTSGKLLPNDFGVPGEFAFRRAVVLALKEMKAKSFRPPDDVLEIVLIFLRENDNNVNEWDDGDYMKELVISAAEILVNYVAGIFEEENRGNDQSESIGTGRSFREMLGKYYEIIDHIRRYLNYDAIESSENQEVTVGCLRALSILEAEGIIEGTTPFFAYAVYNTPVPPHNKQAALIAAHDWGPRVREEAFKSIVHTYLNNRGSPSVFKSPALDDRNVEWLGVFKWVVEAAVQDPCPQLRFRVIKYMLELHADTVAEQYVELEDHSSPSGLYWPLSNSPHDIDQKATVPTKEIIASMWAILNESTQYDGRLRIAVSQLWRAIWRLKAPPVIADAMKAPGRQGPFQDWCDEDYKAALHGRKVKRQRPTSARPTLPSKKMKLKIKLSKKF